MFTKIPFLFLFKCKQFWMFFKIFSKFEELGVKVPSELSRKATENGGHTDLVSRIREMIVPMYISYKDTSKLSPDNADFEKGANWELANNNDTSNKVYVSDKLIPVVQIISRG